MKLYYESGTSALASHIALIEAGFSPQLIKVDIPTHKTAAGDDYYQVNPKGCLPSVIFEAGEKLTETVAILDWAYAFSHLSASWHVEDGNLEEAERSLAVGRAVNAVRLRS